MIYRERGELERWESNQTSYHKEHRGRSDQKQDEHLQNNEISDENETG
jgi:hypothetical protein